MLYFWQGSESPTLWTHAREHILEIAQKAQEKFGKRCDCLSCVGLLI